MLSRRNTRIKVMQSLYAFEIDKERTLDDVIKSFRTSTMDTFNLYLYGLYSLTEFCKIAVEDKRKRNEKYLPTDADIDFEPILFTNKYVQSIYQNHAFQVKCKKEKFKDIINTGVLSRLYKEFAGSDEYRNYVYGEDLKEDDHIEILHHIVRNMRNSESFNEMMDEAYPNWIDDDSLVLGALKRTLKSLPVEESFFMDFYPPQKTTKEFGEKLLLEVNKQSVALNKRIASLLENWDLDRLATLDLLILKMGVVELEEFKNIPSNVTINEYVEMAKLYSTSKSRVFINGILDKVAKGMDENTIEE